jgi:hypothetical protein
LHFSIRDEDKGARVVLEVRTGSEAEIVNAFRFAMVTGDDFEFDSPAGLLTFAFTADDKARHLVVQTRPEGAPLTLTVRADDTIVATHEIEPSDLEVSIAEAESLLNATDDSALRIWYLPFTAGRNRVDLDDETTRTLKALGYIE